MCGAIPSTNPDLRNACNALGMSCFTIHYDYYEYYQHYSYQHYAHDTCYECNIVIMIITSVIIIVVTVKTQILTRALVIGEPRWQGDLRFQNNDLYDL